MTIDSVDESKVPSNDNNDSDVSSDEDDINLELENRTLQIAKKARLETDDSSSKKDTDDAQPDQKLIDLTGVGNINGKPVIDFDIDSMKDKPWMKKGENISDYFNYGFTEDTWKVYQLEIKGKSTDKLPPPPVVTQLSGPPPVIQSGSGRMPPRSPASGPPPSGPPPRPPFSMPPGMPPGMAPPGFQMPPGMPPGMPPLMPPGGMAPPGMFTAKSEPSDEISVKTES